MTDPVSDTVPMNVGGSGGSKIVFSAPMGDAMTGWDMKIVENPRPYYGGAWLGEFKPHAVEVNDGGVNFGSDWTAGTSAGQGLKESGWIPVSCPAGYVLHGLRAQERFSYYAPPSSKSVANSPPQRYM